MVVRRDDNGSYQVTRVIQWLSGERAVDVPSEFDIPKGTGGDQTPSPKGECLELHSLPALNKQSLTTTSERSCLLARRLHRLSPDTQTFDEAYCTLSSRQSAQHSHSHDLRRASSTSESCSLSSATPISTSSPVLSLCVDESFVDGTRAKMDSDFDRRDCQLLPSITNSDDRSRELYREIMRNGNSNERHFKEMVDEFVQLIEKKLSDAEFKMFDDNTPRATSPSLFDMLNDLKTCLTLLRRTEIQSLMNVFDNVLKLHCGPSALPETDQAIATPHQNEELQKLSQYALDQLKIVQIEKGYQPLGLTISRTDAGAIHIARIVVGGLAASTELFQVNDRILEINDQSITGHSLDYVCTLMSSTTGVIKFLLAPPTSPNHISYESFHVRVLYTYDPYNDPLLPCKELGLAFQRGDVLRIVARDDHASNTYSSWWQAYRETSPDRPADACLAGLVPSDSLQRKRADLLRVVSDESESISSSSPSLFDDKRRLSTTCFTCVSSKHERKPFQMVYNNASFIRDSNEKETPTIRTSTNHFSLKDTRQFDEEQPPTTLRRFPEKDKSALDDCFRYYEPVFQLDLTAHKATRPIVLLGAPNVGRHELRRRLLQTEPDLFDVAIPHTTRARRLQETPDVDYHFVSEADFLARVASHSFVEFGQYDQALYGTSVDDIRQVVQSKRRVCILNLNPDAIRTFNKSDLYPYVICIAAPSFDRLRRLELDRREQLSDKEYREIIRKSRSIERRHHTLFDHILVNNDLERTYAELRELIARVHHEQQHWVRTCYRRAST